MPIAITFYIIISVFILILNAIHYFQTKYNLNFQNNTPNKNYSIKFSTYRLFAKTELNFQTAQSIDIIANSHYRSEFNNAFEHSKGYFSDRLLHSFVWPITFIKKLKIFSIVQKIPNKLISFVIGLFEAFAIYLLGLFLDTTGIGNTILTFLISKVSYLVPQIDALCSHFPN